MRLTLRTLLAYIDDILEPAQAREIGQKVKESEVARQLLGRVREVVRRRRLGAPDVDGPDAGLDPNTVAQYLDNTLSPSGVADVERVCLESDVHLAEIAACHQILTLVLGDPIDVSATSRERIYALGPLELAPQLEAAAGGNGRDRSGEAGSATADGDSFESRIPAYLRSDSQWRKYAPFVAMGAVALGWFALIVFDPTLNPFRSEPGDQRVAGVDPNERPGVIPPGGTPDVNERTVVPVRPIPDPIVPEDSGNPVRPAVPVTDPGEANGVDLPADEDINPKPPREEPGLDPMVVVVDPKPPIAVPPGVVPPGVVPPEVVPPADPDPTVATPDALPADIGEPLQVTYASKTGVLLTHDPTIVANAWQVLPRRSILHVGEGVVSPDPFEAQLELRDTVSVLLVGGSRLTMGKAPEGAAIAVQLDRGRFLFERPPVDSNDPDGPAVEDQPAAVPGDPVFCLVAVHGREYMLRLDEPGTKCGIEVRIEGPTGFEEAPNAGAFPANVYLSNGKLAIVPITRTANRDVELSDERMVALDVPNLRLSLSPSAWPVVRAGVESVQPIPEEPLAMPPWMSGDERTLTSSLRRARLQFERDFDSVGTAVETVGPLVKSTNAEVARYAVECLDAIGDESLLVSALATSTHPEARLAAIEGLRTWMANHPVEEVNDRLKPELRGHFQADVAADVYKLLWGFDEGDAREPRVSKNLVEGLGHANPAVRHLAIYHLKRLTGKDFDYFPYNQLAQRAASVRRWIDHLAEQGGVLIPE